MSLKQIISSALVGAGLAYAVSGCGDEEGCKTDNDCAAEAGRYCIDGTCQADGDSGGNGNDSRGCQLEPGAYSCEEMCSHYAYECTELWGGEGCVAETVNCYTVCFQECNDVCYSPEERECVATTPCTSDFHTRCF